MPHVLEAFLNALKMSWPGNEQKSPLHAGEAMNCWVYLALLEDSLAIEQAGANTTTHEQLRELLHEAINTCQGQIQVLREFMKKEGVPMPPATETKPLCESTDIPLGVKATDYEIANGLALKVSAATMTCSGAIVQSVRNDVGLMFTRFMAEQMVYGVNLKAKMQEHGWLKVPPLFSPPGLPHV